jgi:hypothetical protein
MSEIGMLRHLRASLEGAQRNPLLAVDVEERVQPCHLEEVSYSLVDLDKFHLASPLSDGAETSHQFPHATAVHVIHSREIEQESFVAGTGENVYQVPQLRAAVACREFANKVHYNDSVEFSCGDFKAHGEFARFCFSPCGIIHSLAAAFNEAGRTPPERVRSARVRFSDQ